ncbi:polysaccharide deacetylase family protein [Streptomyces sp. ACA25]|uniref:polysaccharide deacetylase family protein n=1 Tax=Streptomyces sp. ACA25 TaxID=3022596 RepID=UPI002307498D|nr:polysaccharide deacetylase family protein [Streptomyces sp. ACA25]MDB1087414.1 polysaccharide deacetylase family protein [Streptomyces sp. ACA25]
MLTGVAALALAGATVVAGPSVLTGQGGSEGPAGTADRPGSGRVPAAGAAPPGGPEPGPAPGSPPRARTLSAAAAVEAYADRLERAELRRAAALSRWGVRRMPPPPPPPPREKPVLTTEPGHLRGEGLPPVISRVPTEDRVVFLTIDDGAEKDPDLLAMTRELGIPYSSFLADYVVRDDYDYFRRMRDDGVALHNHTVHHREMTRLGHAAQRDEICGQQDIMEREFGARPELFRPPYGAYDQHTLRAAAECGVRAVPLWAAEAFADRMEWSRADRVLHPGDIILTHFRGEDRWDGTMPDMVRLVLETAAAQGFALARLEDYI